MKEEEMTQEEEIYNDVMNAPDTSDESSLSASACWQPIETAPEQEDVIIYEPPSTNQIDDNGIVEFAFRMNGQWISKNGHPEPTLWCEIPRT